MTISIIGSRGYPYVYSGYETFVKELSERLVKKGYRVKIYCHKNLFSERPRTVNGIELVYIPTIETKSLSQLIHSGLSMIHACTSGSDIILAVNAANGPWGLISTLFRKRTLINVDGMEWLRPKWKGLGASYFRMAAWLSTKLYNRVITDADAMREVYLEEFQAESTVIAYGAEPRYAQKPEMLDAFDLEPYSYYLIVGRLIPDNNVQILLEGYKTAQSGKKLVVVGDVPYQDEYARNMKAKANADILFLGYITNSETLAELYHHCFAYLHGHEFGGTNPTMLKAMAYGCAILAIDTRFSREMLQDGRFGLLFQKSPQSVAKFMQHSEQNDDLIKNLRHHAREGLTEKYNWDQVTEAYIRVFKELQSNGNKGL